MPEIKAEVIGLESVNVSLISETGESFMLPLSFFENAPAIGQQFFVHVSDASGGNNALARQILNEVLHLGDKA
jgi:hypothetical protein